MKVGKYELDLQQQEIVYDKSNELLVIAGAGSGKTLTIIGKIKYLINNQKINPNDIMCISFTREATLSLENKLKEELNLDINVYTFHKLGLIILENKYKIASTDTLDNIIDNFFKFDIFQNKIILKKLIRYLNLKNIEDYKEYINKKEIYELEKLISTFIKLFKSNNYELNNFNLFIKKIRSINIFKYRKEKTLLTLILNIYIIYQNYLDKNAEIDFDDMLIKAIKNIDKFNKKLKYIIIDEYQDTSYLRFSLIKALKDKTGSKLMVVGDDFQSIYRFTGCDLNLFLNFKKYFKESKILKIENTYRNSNQLINIAGSFVMKNKKQVKKNLKSIKNLNYPIQIVYYQEEKIMFKKLIKYIYNKSHSEILVIGRNNYDIYNFIDNSFKFENNNLVYLDNLDIKIRYLTAHKSKGLESDNTIIINLTNRINGFPNKMKDDSLFRLVTKYEKYPYSEERRLFYVALTRTKNYCYLLTPNNKKSIFIEEILKKYKKKIKILKI